MLTVERVDGSSLLGEPNFVAVERGLAEFKAARPVVIEDHRHVLLILPVDGLDDGRLAAFRKFCAPVRPKLVLSARRAFALGMEADGPVALNLSPLADARAVHALVSNVRVEGDFEVTDGDRAVEAALDLAKLAHRLPAVLTAAIDRASLAMFDPPLVAVSRDAIGQFRRMAVNSLKIASQAQVPLHGGIRARFVVFRGMIGGETAAIVVNDPDLSRPVPVRLHSACLTGDVFGSRRCDCGDQLRLALTQIAAIGGGVILYLDQEGRGLGLANKMRAYELQDEGLDTVDANITLGFEDDERDYGIAGRMLEMMGCTKVHLLTNNPAKINGLTEAGIEIVDRMPLVTPVNVDNRRYLAAKAMRAGHSLDHLFEALPSSEHAVVPDQAEAAE